MGGGDTAFRRAEGKSEAHFVKDEKQQQLEG
jgi:hypothetical protein